MRVCPLGEDALAAIDARLARVKELHARGQRLDHLAEVAAHHDVEQLLHEARALRAAIRSSYNGVPDELYRIGKALTRGDE